MSRAYVLLSGGIDSTTCLAMALKEYGIGNVTGLSLHYGQRHNKEVLIAAEIAGMLGARWRGINIQGAIGIGGLTDENLEMPNSSYADLPHGVSPTYVPFRNGLFLSIATSMAAADSEAVAVYYGAHAEDTENDAYPDCSIDFIDAMNDAMLIGTYGKIHLIAPLMHMTKAGVVTYGDDLGVPWHMTWSCYEGEELHCGTCPTCRSRKEAFEIAGIEDPTEYAA